MKRNTSAPTSVSQASLSLEAADRQGNTPVDSRQKLSEHTAGGEGTAEFQPRAPPVALSWIESEWIPNPRLFIDVGLKPGEGPSCAGMFSETEAFLSIRDRVLEDAEKDGRPHGRD